MEYAKAYLPSMTRNDNYQYRDQKARPNAVPQNQGQAHYCQDNQNTPVTVHAMLPDPDVHVQVNDDYLPSYIDYNNLDELEQVQDPMLLCSCWLHIPR